MSRVLLFLAFLIMKLQQLFHHFLKFPWRNAISTLRNRFGEDHLGVSAGSLTFTTTIALVPLITVILAVFTAFPAFAKFQVILQNWLIQSLIPENIARQVLGYLTQFSGKASKLGFVGLLVLIGTSLTLIFTIDRTLNQIWHVRNTRLWGQKILIYWAAISLGPILLAISLSATTYAIPITRGVTGVIPATVQIIVEVIQFLMMAVGVSALYHFVPNTKVLWRYAFLGGIFVAGCFEIAKILLGLYLSQVPTYSLIYGAFATLPILLIWIYVAWVIVLLGAVLVSYMPSFVMGTSTHQLTPGFELKIALDIISCLDKAYALPSKGLCAQEIATKLRLEMRQLEPILENMCTLDWLGLLDENNPNFTNHDSRYVLLVDPNKTLISPLLQRFLLTHDVSTQRLWKISNWDKIILSEVI